ncbi:hypothetical protein PV325_003986 [Microctonus aethiopoides]|nr:hypothetical protein PV325_003986 [Microctonus aethiopoides]
MAVNMTRTSMNFFNHSHYIAGKNFTRAIGQWPYQRQWESRICGFVTVFLVTSHLIAEVTGIIVYIDDKEVVLESVTPFMTAIFCGSKYINAMLNVKTMKKLLNHLEEDWIIHTSKDEIRILNEYAHFGKFLICGYARTTVFMTEPLMPKLINFIFHLNETVPNRYPVPIDWYQLENLLSRQNVEKELESGKFRTTNDVQYNYYMMCIKKHKRAIKFAKLLEDMYVWCFGVVMGVNTLLISFTALQLITQTSTIRQIVKYIMFAGAQIMCLFCDCYLSQQLTDTSNNIQEHITLSNWYKMPLHTQKLAILVILRSQTPCKLTAGKIVPLSMETFVSIIKTAVSYFTVLVSVQ